MITSDHCLGNSDILRNHVISSLRRTEECFEAACGHLLEATRNEDFLLFLASTEDGIDPVRFNDILSEKTVVHQGSPSQRFRRFDSDLSTVDTLFVLREENFTEEPCFRRPHGRLPPDDTVFPF